MGAPIVARAFTFLAMSKPTRAESSLASGAVTLLFTDVEGSSRLWEEEPERMKPALAWHDAISRAAVESHRGLLVKSTGDGVHAAFDNAVDALGAAVDLQQAIGDPTATNGVSAACALRNARRSGRAPR